jgi:hypothetical protein
MLPEALLSAPTPFVLLQETTNFGPTDKFNISSQQQTFQSQFLYSGVNALYLGGDSGAAAAGAQYVNFVEFGGTHQGTLNIVDTSDDSEFSSDSLRDISYFSLNFSRIFVEFSLTFHQLPPLLARTSHLLTTLSSQSTSTSILQTRVLTPRTS